MTAVRHGMRTAEMDGLQEQKQLMMTDTLSHGCRYQNRGKGKRKMIKFILGMIVGASIGFMLACLVRANDD